MKTNKRNPEYIMKMGFVAIGIVLVLAIIIASFFWELIFDPNDFDVNKWATRAIFNGSIALAMMVLGFVAINESMEARENGKYQKRLSAFNDLITALFDSGRVIYFDQYITWNAERQLTEKKITYLTRHGMHRMEAMVIVEYATLDDIPTLSGLTPGEKHSEKPTGKSGEDIVRLDRDGNEILIPKFRDTLATYVEDVLDGTISVNAEDASYYMSSSKNKDGNLTSLERAQATEKDRVRSLWFSFGSKIVIGLIYSTIVALFAVDNSSGAGTAEAFWTLLFRLVSATLGFTSGGFAGNTNSRFLYKVLGEKMKVIREYNKFCDTGEFKPKTYAETSKERIAEVHRKEEEAKKSVVTPEVFGVPLIEGK